MVVAQGGHHAPKLLFAGAPLDSLEARNAGRAFTIVWLGRK